MLATLLLAPLSPVSASTFSPSLIISDSDFFDTKAMSLDDIQNFLVKKGSGLANYSTYDVNGQTKTAAQIISESATRYGISPKVLLVLLQKEQSLIEDPSPSQYSYDWATGFAICDSCSPNDAQVVGYKGFAKQVDRAAWRKVYYTTNPNEFTFRPGLTSLVDGLPVTPQNSATAALYNYTPHIKGNYSFWRLWQRYFGKSLPDGMVVQIPGQKGIWLIANGQKRYFSSIGVFLSRYSRQQLVDVSLADLSNYPDGAPIKYSQYSLLRSPKGAIFLLVDDKKYGIVSQKVFRQLGYNPEEVVTASAQDLDAIPQGGLITSATSSPTGELWQDKKTGGVFYVKDGVKHPIAERAVLKSNFPYNQIKRVNTKDLDKLTAGDPVLFRDGTLLTSADKSAYYLVSNGSKRQFTDLSVFHALGFDLKNVITTSSAMLDLLPTGDSINLGLDVPNTDTPTTSLISSNIGQ